MAREEVVLFINDIEHAVTGADAALTLSDFLRYRVHLTGTKVVCAEGDCGACTVLRFFPLQDAAADFEPINSCITTIAQLDGSAIYTIEAIQNTALQKSMVECHGSQCGFCTPGIVMALTGLAEKRASAKSLTEVDAKNALTGNLCRCTGYQGILDAAQAADLTKYQRLENSFSAKWRRRLKEVICTELIIESENFKFFAPTTLKAAAKFLAKNKSARVIGAGTDLGVAVNKNKICLDEVLSLHLIPELYAIKKNKKQVQIGARVTLAQLRREMKALIPEFANFLNLFASPQIKNSATLVGNVANASPIADTPPFLLAMHAQVVAVSAKGERVIPIDQFFKSYRKTELRPGEIIASIRFDIPNKNEKLTLNKASQRKDLDISCVNAALRMRLQDKKVHSVTLALGGVGPIPMRLRKTEEFLMHRELNPDTVGMACQRLQEEIQPIDDLRGSSAFRRVLAESYLRSFLESE